MTVSSDPKRAKKKRFLKILGARLVIGIAVFTAFCAFSTQIAEEQIATRSLIMLMITGPMYGVMFMLPGARVNSMLWVVLLAFIMWPMPISVMWVLIPMASVAFMNGILLPYPLPRPQNIESAA